MRLSFRRTAPLPHPRISHRSRIRAAPSNLCRPPSGYRRGTALPCRRPLRRRRSIRWRWRSCSPPAHTRRARTHADRLPGSLPRSKTLLVLRRDAEDIMAGRMIGAFQADRIRTVKHIDFAARREPDHNPARARARRPYQAKEHQRTGKPSKVFLHTPCTGGADGSKIERGYPIGVRRCFT
jgi:hypothetical protein